MVTGCGGDPYDGDGADFAKATFDTVDCGEEFSSPTLKTGSDAHRDWPSAEIVQASECGNAMGQKIIYARFPSAAVMRSALLADPPAYDTICLTRREVAEDDVDSPGDFKKLCKANAGDLVTLDRKASSAVLYNGSPSKRLSEQFDRIRDAETRKALRLFWGR